MCNCILPSFFLTKKTRTPQGKTVGMMKLHRLYLHIGPAVAGRLSPLCLRSGWWSGEKLPLQQWEVLIVMAATGASTAAVTNVTTSVAASSTRLYSAQTPSSHHLSDLEGLSLMWEPVYMLSLTGIDCQSTIRPPPLQLCAQSPNSPNAKHAPVVFLHVTCDNSDTLVHWVLLVVNTSLTM